MDALTSVPASAWHGIHDQALALADGWITRLRDTASRDGVALLSGLREDPESFEFTRKLIEFVAGTEDAFTSALGLREMALELPAAMPVRDRLAMRAGGVASLGLPWAVMPVARRWLRERVSTLVLAERLPAGGDPGRMTALSDVLRGHTDAGFVPVVMPLGEHVHGPAAAAAEAARLASLAAHPAVSHLVVDPERLVPGGTDWSIDHDVARAASALRPVCEAALAHDTVVQLCPTSVRWARVVVELCEAALADQALDRVRVGVRLFAELPETREAYAQLARWAQRRVADGGSAVEVVLGVAGVASAERIAAILSGLPVPVLEDPQAVTAQFLRLIELGVHQGRAAVLRPVIASEDPYVLAAAAALAANAGTATLFSVQLRSGLVPGLGEALLADLPEVRIALPVVSPKELSGAAGLIIGYAAEAADPESDIGWLERGISEERAQQAEAEAETEAGAESVAAGAEAVASAGAAALARFSAALELAAEQAPRSHRTQLRAREWDPSERDSALFYRAPDEAARFDTGGLTAAVLGLTQGETGELELSDVAPPRAIPVISASGFACEPATDATLRANREWARELLQRAAERGGERDAANATVALSPADLDPEAAAEAARTAGVQWAEQSPRTRAVRLRRTALAVVAARDRLLQTLAVDTGAPITALDGEINNIVDAARYYAQLAEGLQTVRGATFVPVRLTLVTAGQQTPFSDQAESVLAALAAGSGVLWAVPQRCFSSAVALLEEWEVGGLTPGSVRLEAVAVAGTLPVLAASQSIDRAVVLGDREQARALARLRPELPVEGRFAARGAILIAPSADLDSAITDLVASAFGRGGADPRTVGCALLLGGVGRSRRFRDGLADAVAALGVGDTAGAHDAAERGADPLAYAVGPLASPPDAAGMRALTELGRGESWLVEPRQLDADGRLWSPGVRLGVSLASSFWEDARGLPLLGVIHVHTFDEAVHAHNVLGSGAVAGIASHDEAEVLDWLDRVEAAALSVNRATTGAHIERQPGGGWNRAAMGLPALSGGPNRLVTLGSWRMREGTRSETLHLRGLEPEVQQLIEAAQPLLGYEEFDAVRRAALSDALTWRVNYGVVRDVIGLGIERNALRYRPVAVQVRLAEGGSLASLVRVLCAALLVRSPVSVSTGEVLPPAIAGLLVRRGIDVSLERDDDWLERIAVAGAIAGDRAPAVRIRLIGGDRVRAAEWLGGPDRAALWAEPVTMAGPVELLTLLREQSVSVRAHRHGLAIAAPGLDTLIEG